MADFVFEDPFDDSLETILQSLFEQVEILWPDPNNRPDLREGSLLWTLLSPVAFEVQRFQSDLNLALEASFLQFTFGNFLDLRGIELGLPRKQGSKALGILRFLGDIGVAVPIGTTASTIAIDEDDDTYAYDTTDSGLLEGVESPVTLNEVQSISLGGTGRFELYFDGALVNTYDISGPPITGIIIEADLDGMATTNYANVRVTGDSGIVNAGGASIVFDGGTPYVPGEDVSGRDVPLLTFVPVDVNEIQQLEISGTGTFEVTFDGEETVAVLTETSTGQDVVNAINALPPTVNNTYGLFAVSTTTPLANVNDPGGILITFDAGGVQYQDVPLIQITSKTGTIAEVVTEVTPGEDSTVAGDIVEVTKGRTAPPTTSTADQNEIQRISFKPSTVSVTTPTTGIAGAKNELQRLTVVGSPASGGLTLLSPELGGPTVNIPFNGTAATIQSALEALPSINIGDVLVTLVSGGPTLQANGVYDIEYKGNLRYTNFSPLIVDNTAMPVGSAGSINTIFHGAPGTSEIQTIQYVNGPPSGGTFDLTIQGYPGFLPSVVPNIPFDVEAGELQLLLEGDPVYGTGVTDSFSISGASTAATIETAMFGMANVDNFPQDVIVTLVSGGPTPADPGPTVYQVEYTGQYLQENLQPLEIVSSSNDFAAVGAVVITTLQNGGPGVNEKHLITFNGSPSVGAVQIQFNNAVSGESFKVTGGPLNTNPINIDFGGLDGAGKNRDQQFRPLVVTPYFTGTPTSGQFKLLFTDNAPVPVTGTSGLIDFDASTQDVETALVTAPNIGAGDVAVKVATGFQTISFTGVPTAGDFTLTVDNGTTDTTGPIAFNATAAAVQTEFEGLTNVGVGNVLVTTSGGTLDTGATYTVHLLTSHTENYKHFVVATNTLAAAATTVNIGPLLNVPGAAYEIEFLNALTTENFQPLEYEASTLTLAPQPNTPVIIPMQEGSTIPAANEKQLLSLSHPSGYFRLGFGSSSPNRTAFISPLLDTNTSIDNKLEALGDIGVTNLTTLGGPITSAPVTVEFSGGPLGFIDQNTMTVHNSSVAGGLLVGPEETQKGFSTGLADQFIINFNDNAAAIQTAIENLVTVGPGDVIVTPIGGTTTPQAGGAQYDVEFTGALSNKNFQLMTTSNNTFTPGLTTVSINPVVNGSTTQNEKQRISFVGGPTAGSVTVEFNNAIGGAGVITGVVQYGYTLVTKLGTQEGLDDTDFETGYGVTGLSTLSTPINVTNKKVLLSIEPILLSTGLNAVRKINIYRSLDGSDFKLVGAIQEGDINFTFLGDNEPPANMFFVDNVPVAEFNAIPDLAPGDNTTGVLELTAEAQEIGEAQNATARSIEFLEDFIAGINKVTNPEDFSGGSDVETDDAYRQRLIEEAQKDPGAGNVDDYVGWAKEIAGVESVTVIPEWQEIYGPLEGAGTVKVIVAGENSTILPAEKVEEVRQFIAGTIAIPDPDQDAPPAALAVQGGNIEDGTYEYSYTFFNVGRGETKASAAARITLDDGDNTVQLSIPRGQGGLGVQNTLGRRIYRRKVDGALPGEPESDRAVLVAEVLNNSDTTYIDDLAFADLPILIGYPHGPYLNSSTQFILEGPFQRRKAPIVNSTSVYDGEAPIGAHVTVEPITDETIWVDATIYPNFGYSIDGTGGTVNLTTQLDIALADFFSGLAAGQDLKIIDVANVIHDHAGVKDFKDLVLFSPAFPTGTEDNISIGSGVVATYSSAGTFSLWTAYPYDR